MSYCLTLQVGNQPKIKDQDCIRLHMGLLTDTVRDHAKKWISSLGTLPKDTSKENMFRLKNQLEVSQEDTTLGHIKKKLFVSKLLCGSVKLCTLCSLEGM